MLWLVTVKTKPNPAHNPRNKITGICPAFGNECSDTTGAHHTTVVEAETIADAHAVTKIVHKLPVTRIEAIT